MAELNEEKSLRYNDGKVDYTLFDLSTLAGMAKVLEYGARKYSRDNWKKKTDESTTMASLLRHIARMQDGEERDFDPACESCQKGEFCKSHSGLPHIDHILCNAYFIKWHQTHRLSKTVSYKGTLTSLNQKEGEK